MEYIIILLWALGALSFGLGNVAERDIAHTLKADIGTGSSDFGLMLIWPITLVIIFIFIALDEIF